MNSDSKNQHLKGKTLSRNVKRRMLNSEPINSYGTQRINRAQTSQKTRMKLISRQNRHRPNTRREHSPNLKFFKTTSQLKTMNEKINLANYDSSAMFDKFKLNFDRVLFVNCLNRPLSVQNVHSQEECKRNSKVKFRNIFIF